MMVFLSYLLLNRPLSYFYYRKKYNTNVFDHRGKPFSLNYGDTHFIILPMYSCWYIGEGKILHVAPEIFGLIEDILLATYFTISVIEDKYRLNFYLQEYSNTNKWVGDSRHIPLSVEYLGMIWILVIFKTIMHGVLLQMVTITH